MGGWWRPGMGIGLGVLILLGSLSLLPHPLAIAPPPPPSHEASEAMLDPVQIEAALSRPPVIGQTNRLSVHFQSGWVDLWNMRVSFDLSEGILVSDPEVVPFALSVGEPRTLEFQIVPLVGGTHRVAIRATGLSDSLGNLGGQAVIYVRVPDRGAGEIFYENPPVDSPQGAAVMVANPVSLNLVVPRGRPPGPSGPNPSDTPRAHGSLNVTGQWNYWLEDDVTTAPQRWATVEVWDEDAGNDDLLWTGLTNATGNFTASDLPRAEEPGEGNQDVYVRFVACNAAVCVQTTGGMNYSWQTATVTVGTEDELSFGSRAPASNQFAPRPFQYINNAWDYAVNLGGLASVLGQVRVFIPDACTFYTLSDNTIHLCADGVDDKSPDDVGHEYAHYVQDKLYGDTFWPSPGGFHSACGDGQPRGLSWTEGFADFFGPRAHTEIVDSQDHFYDRPWDGSIFSFDLEDVGVCSTSVQGDDNEMRVATALWDLADDVDDATLDIGIQHSAAILLDAINGCDQASYRAFYDGGQCNWLDRGNPGLDFLVTAFLNTIDYNQEPEAEVTSPSAFGWLEETLVVVADVVDPDTPVASVEFRVSPSATCGSFELPRETDTSSPYAVTLNIGLLPEAANYWVCARAADPLEVGAWSASSSSFGVDKTPPVSVATVTGTLGPEGWYVTTATVDLASVDATSGVTAISYRLDSDEVLLYTGPFEVQGDGVHTVAFFATDAAGNVEGVQPLLVLIDLGPPLIQILQPTSGAYLGQATVHLTWSVTDAGSGVEGCSVRLDGGPSISVGEDTSFTFVGVPDGPHRALVACQDRIDGVAEEEVPFTVDTNPFSITGPFGPTLILAFAGFGLLAVALYLRRKR